MPAAPEMTLEATRERHRMVAEMDWASLAVEEFPELFGPGVSVFKAHCMIADPLETFLAVILLLHSTCISCGFIQSSAITPTYLIHDLCQALDCRDPD
jgi:hypothetical protein